MIYRVFIKTVKNILQIINLNVYNIYGNDSVTS